MIFSFSIPSPPDFGAKAATLKEAARQQLNIELIGLQAYIVTEKLQGQVLHRRSGTLADSVRVKLAEVNGNIISGSIEGGGGPAWYGRVFEEGGQGPYTIVPIKAKALRWLDGSGNPVFAKKVNHPAIPKKPWMKPAVDEKLPQIQTNVRLAAIRALQA